MTSRNSQELYANQIEHLARRMPTHPAEISEIVIEIRRALDAILDTPPTR